MREKTERGMQGVQGCGQAGKVCFAGKAGRHVCVVSREEVCVCKVCKAGKGKAGE